MVLNQSNDTKMEAAKIEATATPKDIEPSAISKKDLKKASKMKKDGSKSKSKGQNGCRAAKFHGSDPDDIFKVLFCSEIYGHKVVPSKSPGFKFSKSCLTFESGDDFIFETSACCKYFQRSGESEKAQKIRERFLGEISALEIEKNGSELLLETEGILTNGKSMFLNGDCLSIADAILCPKLIECFEKEANNKENLKNTENYIREVKGTLEYKSALENLESFVDVCIPKSVEYNDDFGMVENLKTIFAHSVEKSFAEIKSFNISIVKCAQAKYGDYQCNSPLSLYPLVNKEAGTNVKSPKDVALALIENMPPSIMIESTSVSGPGFINIKLRSDFLKGAVKKIIAKGPEASKVERLKILLDFSGPNIAKEMHVGHLRSTIIGDAIARILSFCGHEVLRVNHFGDWGTQFGMLINHMKSAHPNFLHSPPNITDLNSFYKEAKRSFDKSEEFKQASRKTVVKLQSGDKECTEAWKLLCGISKTEFQKVYDRLRVRLEECGESFYNSMIPETMEKMDKKGILKVEDGATLCMMEHFTYPLIVKKSDGGYGYDSTDMAAVDYRLNRLDCDWVVYVTDAGQKSHFDMIFDAAKACGWVNSAKQQRLEHIGFGVVQGEDGKKFKSRSGDTVRLVDLLDEAVKRMRDSLSERVASGKSHLSPDKVEKGFW
mmetsp:Transcript_18993/g.28017  ORF Transcript_18993/g.28017 Transcript_18993/m.28017 type:complete len:663 (-) Transcript_18993:701-2689(-)